MYGSPWGGSELLWSQAAEILHKDGHQVMASVHGWSETPPPIAKLRQLGICINERHIEKLGIPARVANKVIRTFSDKPRQDKNWLEIIKFKPDLVCVSHGGTICGVPWMLRCLKAKIPYISISQGYSERDWISDREIDDVTNAYLGARRAYFVAEHNERLLETKMGERLPQAEVVWNPFNVRWDINLKWPKEDQGFQLACVGRMEPYDKGQDILCHIMNKSKWRERGIVVNLFGSGSCQKSISKLIKMLNLEKIVIYRGQVHDISEVWRHNHAAVMPSRTEGLPLALVEAMLCRRFGIVTDVGDSAKPINNNINGFIAKAATVEIFEEAMECAWVRRHEWMEIGLNARADIEKLVPPNPGEEFSKKILNL
jgi:glycosyltransferase involved in cell wall biosynthesis